MTFSCEFRHKVAGFRTGSYGIVRKACPVQSALPSKDEVAFGRRLTFNDILQFEVRKCNMDIIQ